MKSRDPTNYREREKREPGHLQPELMRHPAKRSSRSAHPAEHGAAGAAMAQMAGGHTGCNPDLLQCGDLNHRSILAVGRRTMLLGKSQRPVISAARDVPSRGGLLDPQLKQLMKELGEAINESLADSEQIAEVVARIKEGGYDIFLVLEATIGVSKQGVPGSDKTSLVSTLSTNPELKVSDQDLKFLKSLRIKIEEEEEEVE